MHDDRHAYQAKNLVQYQQQQVLACIVRGRRSHRSTRQRKLDESTDRCVRISGSQQRQQRRATDEIDNLPAAANVAAATAAASASDPAAADLAD